MGNAPRTQAMVQMCRHKDRLKREMFQHKKKRKGRQSPRSPELNKRRGVN